MKITIFYVIRNIENLHHEIQFLLLSHVKAKKKSQKDAAYIFGHQT